MSQTCRVNALAEAILADMLDIPSAVLQQYWRDVKDDEGPFVAAVVDFSDSNVEVQSFSNGQAAVDIIGSKIGLQFELIPYDTGLVGLGFAQSNPGSELRIASSPSIIGVLRCLDLRTNGEVADAMVSSQLQQAIRQK